MMTFTAPSSISNETPGPAPGPARFRAISVIRSYEQVVSQIEAAIRSGQYKRGERLPAERDLATDFDVSRGVIREAIRVLNAMGLVESRQGSGVFVRNDPMPTVTRAFVLSVSPNLESVERLFEFRLGLEVEASRFAAIRRSDLHLATLSQSLQSVENTDPPADWNQFGVADDQFHNAIAEASGNPYLHVAITTARHMQRDVVDMFALHPGSIQIAITHHRALIEAIAAADSESAARHMHEHISYTAQAVQTNVLPTGVSISP